MAQSATAQAFKERDEDFFKWLHPQGFALIRNGLRNHVDDGNFTVGTWAVYNYLQSHAHWGTGVCWTNAETIARHLKSDTRTTFASHKRRIQRALATLRQSGYINYAEGDGKKGSYPIFIHKYKVAAGSLKGYQLNAFYDKNLQKVAYKHRRGHVAEASLKCRADVAEVSLICRGSVALVSPILDINKEYSVDELDSKIQTVRDGEGQEPTGLNFEEEQ